MLLRTFGILVLFTGMAAAQTPAERAPRGPNRDGVRTARALDMTRAPAERAPRAANRAPNRDTPRTDRVRDGAPTPAERASGSLNRDVRADRFRDAARDARGDDRPIRPEVQQFEPQRRTLQPDVGRPEQAGRLSTEGLVGGLPSMGPNPQR
jgi:hypothetical protein